MLKWKVVFRKGGMRGEEIVMANGHINARKLIMAKYGGAITIISVTRA